ncbi:putative leader peptide [Streptomyces sp. 8L]
MKVGSMLTRRRHVDYGRLASAFCCPAAR